MGEKVEGRLVDPFAFTDDEYVAVRYLPSSNFSTDQLFLEYGRNFCLRFISTWLRPRLSHFCRHLRDSMYNENNVEVDLVKPTVAVETLLFVLPRFKKLTDELLSLFFSPTFLASPRGVALLGELRYHLMRDTCLRDFQFVLIDALQLSFAIFTSVPNIGRSEAATTVSDEDKDSDLEGEVGGEAAGGFKRPTRSSAPKRRRSGRAAWRERARQHHARIRDAFGPAHMESPSSLLRDVSAAPIEAVAKERVRRVVEKLCADFECVGMFSKLEKTMRTVATWASELSGRKTSDVIGELEDLLEKSVIHFYTDRIYAITVSEFPRSEPAVDILRYCMSRQENFGREKIVCELVSEIERRLLHVGVSTSAILAAYASAVESLRLLDSTCVLMHRVGRVIREYIKKRPDTVRQIITYITTEKRDELCEMRGRSAIVDESDIAGVNDEFLAGSDEDWGGTSGRPWDQWMPDPPDAPPEESGRFRRSADVFNMLVSVYGTKELFVKEYRQLLAERLSSAATKDPLFERRYLELLKLRFSEGELQQCEVMLRDVSDSSRVDSAAKMRAQLISGRVISAHFWPTTENEKGVEKFPEEIETAMTEYAKVYEEIKKDRCLNWIRAAGCMELTLTVDGVRVQKVVPNIYVPIIVLFTQKEEWELSELASALNVPQALAKRRLEWWLGQGVLTVTLPPGATSEVYRLTKNPSNLERFKASTEADEEEEEEEETEDPLDAVESLEQYWKYTKSFIANQERSEIRPERLLTIYKMFSSPSSQSISLDTVIAFLQRKITGFLPLPSKVTWKLSWVKLNLLTFHNGVYRAVKEPAAPSGTNK